MMTNNPKEAHKPINTNKDCAESWHDGLTDAWEAYQDSDKYWHWKRITQKGVTVGASCDSYESYRDCILNAARHGLGFKEYYRQHSIH